LHSVLEGEISALSKRVVEMAELAERTVRVSVDAFLGGNEAGIQLRNWSDELRSMQENVEGRAVEIIARYQPVATDLRRVKSLMKVSYDLSRFGRYAYDIARTLELMGQYGPCELGKVYDMASKAVDVISASIRAFRDEDLELARRIDAMDSEVDGMYIEYVRGAVKEPPEDVKCLAAGLLFARHLERMADHAVYISKSVIYMLTGQVD
jgi:phosphate transport system protein